MRARWEGVYSGREREEEGRGASQMNAASLARREAGEETKKRNQIDTQFLIQSDPLGDLLPESKKGCLLGSRDLRCNVQHEVRVDLFETRHRRDR